jgi:hypothetical protein
MGVFPHVHPFQQHHPEHHPRTHAGIPPRRQPTAGHLRRAQGAVARARQRAGPARGSLGANPRTSPVCPGTASCPTGPGDGSGQVPLHRGTVGPWPAACRPGPCAPARRFREEHGPKFSESTLWTVAPPRARPGRAMAPVKSPCTVARRRHRPAARRPSPLAATSPSRNPHRPRISTATLCTLAQPTAQSGRAPAPSKPLAQPTAQTGRATHPSKSPCTVARWRRPPIGRALSPQQAVPDRPAGRGSAACPPPPTDA